jgi:hypothetical protein
VISFVIRSGVRQGCVQPPMLFGIAMDWALKTSKMETAGSKWVGEEKPSDVDSADDITLLHVS